MAQFTVIGTKAASTPPLSALIITSGGTSSPRPRIKQLVLSASGAPSSDAGFNAQIRRATTAGTATAVTPNPCDPAETACETTAGSNATAEPTYTANQTLLDMAINPRNTWTWMPYQSEGELIIPATANNGIGIQIADFGGAPTVRACATFGE
jgi:hypothetical protein